jgi:subtilisin family serine protease
VIVGVLDTGFDLSHEVFQHLEVIAEHDFIHNDDITANEPGQDTSGQDSHGTSVLSILSGYSPGNLIGPAFAARYLLAKTEEASFERQVEEDWWVEAIEWLEMEGAEAASTSLGYCDWYKTADLDGRTAKITIAADMAVDRGVTMVVLMGNAGQGCEFMWPPADGFKVISVGAVDVNGIVSGFSMRGPTADGRIKPDVMARGTIGTVMAEPHSTSDYKSNTRGTSFATPLVAGTAALLLQAFPTATPADIALALKSTASNASAPNNDYGWGIVNAEAAYEFLVENIAMSETVPPVAISDLSTAGKKPGSIALITTFGYIKQTALFQNYPNPFNPETWIPYRLANDAHVVIWIYDSAGCLIRELNLGQRKAGFYLDKDKAAYWDGKNSLGEQVASGAYFYQLEAGDFVAIRKLAIVK